MHTLSPASGYTRQDVTEFAKILTGWSIDRRASQPGGGAVAGGRIAGTWPGLGQSQLFENRDLAPTTDLRAVALGCSAITWACRHRASPPSFPAPAA